MTEATRVVHRREDGDDPRTILATTYQMRNPFRQFADGVASELDVLCYFEHAQAADLCPKGGAVLDVCCGRGLLIPFLRYRAAPRLYCGVDLHPANARWSQGADPRREKEQATYPFPLHFVESNVANMSEPVRAVCPDPFDLIVFSSSIEHMQPDAQQAALACCRALAAPNAVLYLTCPVTPEGQSGYATQYAAHVYEPTDSELHRWLRAAGWAIRDRYGLVTKTKHFRAVLPTSGLAVAERLYASMPREQALPTIAALFPTCALEVAYVCVPV
jgi:SAM-dependent methyltransferase